MRKIILLVLFLASLIAVVYVLGRKSEPTLGANLTEAQILTAIANFQGNYVAGHGRYFQGLRTLSPGTETKKPYYQTESWSDVVTFVGTLPYEIEVHQYVTAKGEKGYNVIFRKTELGKEYIKSVGYGVQAANKTFDWLELNKQ